MRHPRLTIATVTLAVAATAGGVTIAAAAGGSTPSGPQGAGSLSGYHANTAPHSMDKVTTAGTAGLVRTATADVQGRSETILVDSKGRPLYTYGADSPTTSHVSGSLAALWPALTSQTPTSHAAGGTLTAVSTTNGHQVAFNGHFLYTFVQDRPGQVTGQGVANFSVATPGLAAAAPVAATSSAPMWSNGY